MRATVGVDTPAFSATVVMLPGPGGKVDLAAMLRDLAQREVNELHVEAGHKLNGSLVREGLVDEFLVYLAPKLLGPGRPMAQFGPLADLADGIPLQFREVDRAGDDLRVLLHEGGLECRVTATTGEDEAPPREV